LQLRPQSEAETLSALLLMLVFAVPPQVLPQAEAVTLPALLLAFAAAV
jgi:hypothetical protein